MPITFPFSRSCSATGDDTLIHPAATEPSLAGAAEDTINESVSRGWIDTARLTTPPLVRTAI